MEPEQFTYGLSLVTKKYAKTLATYFRWANCRTPLEQFSAFLADFWVSEDEPLFAYKHPFDCLYVYESLGVRWPCRDSDGDLALLWRGKGVRDWWAKEIAENRRLTPDGGALFSMYEFRELAPVRQCFEELLKWNQEPKILPRRY